MKNIEYFSKRRENSKLIISSTRNGKNFSHAKSLDMDFLSPSSLFSPFFSPLPPFLSSCQALLITLKALGMLRTCCTSAYSSNLDMKGDFSDKSANQF